jgi:hypothetical protein
MRMALRAFAVWVGCFQLVSCSALESVSLSFFLANNESTRAKMEVLLPGSKASMSLIFSTSVLSAEFTSRKISSEAKSSAIVTPVAWARFRHFCYAVTAMMASGNFTFRMEYD